MSDAIASGGAGTMTSGVPDRILREAETRAMCGLSRSTRWRLMRAGAFPKAIQIGPRAVGWVLSDIQAWLAERRRHPNSTNTTKLFRPSVGELPRG